MLDRGGSFGVSTEGSVDEEWHARCLANVREAQASYICAVVYSVPRMSEDFVLRVAVSYGSLCTPISFISEEFWAYPAIQGLEHQRIFTHDHLDWCVHRDISGLQYHGAVCVSHHPQRTVSRCGYHREGADRRAQLVEDRIDETSLMHKGTTELETAFARTGLSQSQRASRTQSLSTTCS